MRRPDDHRTVKSSANFFRWGLSQASHFVSKKLAHRSLLELTRQKQYRKEEGGKWEERRGKGDGRNTRKKQRQTHREKQRWTDRGVNEEA